MGIENYSKDVLFVDLPSEELEIADELKKLNETVNKKPDCDVIIDFSRVEIVSSSSISNLLILRGLLAERQRQLFLCNVAIMTRYIFVVAGLKEVFNFVDDKSIALAAVQHAD